MKISTDDDVIRNDDGQAITRLEGSYINRSDRFIMSHRSFDRQYAPFYNARLNLCCSSLSKKVREKYGSSVTIKRLCDLSAGEHVVVIGTLCKHMELRPSILKEISEEHHLVPQPVTDTYSNDDDFLILEDDIQHITLTGNVDPHSHVTGIIVAVSGHETDDGKFNVEDMFYVSIPNVIQHPFLEDDRYVLIVSGLNIGSPDVLLPLQLFVDYVTGAFGDLSDLEKMSSVVRVIIAGNSICETSSDKEFSNKAKYLTRKTKASSVESIKVLDDILADLASSINVDIMPGELDPSSHLLPQQPLHLCMFPKACGYSTFHSVTNPYDAEICGVRFLGTSGQNIQDVMAYSRLEDPVDVMERTLNWGHISPTAPDTLNCYPYFDKDPFVITDCPHIYFAGNMPKSSHKKYEMNRSSVTIVSVPKFSETFTAVLVNVRTMNVESISFKEAEL